MNENESFEEFVRYIYRDHLERKLMDERRRHFHFLEEWSYFIPRLTRAMHALRFIEGYFDEHEDIIGSLTPEMVDKTLDAVENGVRQNNRMTVETGIADVIQDYFAEIVSGMNVEHLPAEDLAVLAQSGSRDPHREATAIVHLLKSRKERLLRDSQEIRFSGRLERAAELIAQRRKEPRVMTNEPTNTKVKAPVNRRWFKGIGTICQGTLLSLTNISMAAGWWGIPLPIETKTVGAVISITSGIGTMLIGIGELRGE